ncbi:unnamed protein product, partial [Brassica rapa]
RIDGNAKPCVFSMQSSQGVDASWKSSREEMGFGWSLHRREGTKIMHGSSAEAPMNSTLEAEAIALL